MSCVSIFSKTGVGNVRSKRVGTKNSSFVGTYRVSHRMLVQATKVAGRNHRYGETEAGTEEEYSVVFCLLYH